jgi:hypothetical protein
MPKTDQHFRYGESAMGTDSYHNLLVYASVIRGLNLHKMGI